MTWSFAKARTEVATYLETGLAIDVLPYAPEVINAPQIYVLPGDPHIEPGEGFRGKLVRISLRLVIDPASNEEGSEAIDKMTGDVIDWMEDQDGVHGAFNAIGYWTFESASQPFPYVLVEGNEVYLASDVVFTADITIREV